MAGAITTVLFDLDDTLIAEMASEETSFLAVCAPVAEAYGVAAHDLARAVRARARELWRGFEAHPFCRRIGFASWEGLWSTFAGSAPELDKLRNWAATYHHEAWARGLADVGIDDSALADKLSANYQRERQQHHVAFAESAVVLEDLHQDYRLGLLTNGAEDIQSRKLAGSGLAGYFDAVVITGAISIGKPYARPFEVILEKLNAEPREAVMVGNSLSSDIQGARNAGLYSIWLNLDNSWAEQGITPDAEINALTQLRDLLRNIG